MKAAALVRATRYVTIVRELLHLVREQLSDEALRRLWKGLDENGNGTISAGEWGRFMRRGAPTPGTPPRERMLARRAAGVAKERLASIRQYEEESVGRFEGVEGRGSHTQPRRSNRCAFGARCTTAQAAAPRVPQVEAAGAAELSSTSQLFNEALLRATHAVPTDPGALSARCAVHH